jgi:hypothetical protein
MRRAGRAASAVLVALLAPSGVARAQAQLAEAPGARSAAEERWPLEAIRRPLTLPAMMTAFGVALSGFRPDQDLFVNSATGAVTRFNSSATLGVSLSFGVLDRLQASIAMPRFLCVETDGPSGCTGNGRYDGAGATVRALAVRGEELQVAPAVRVSVSSTRPDTLLRWWIDTWLKYTAYDTAVTFGPTLTRTFGTTPDQPFNPWLLYLPFGFSAQLAQRLRAYGVVQPWGSVEELGQGIALQLYAGVSYVFGRHVEVDLMGGAYNVLDHPTWYRSLGGSFVQLEFVFWRY